MAVSLQGNLSRSISGITQASSFSVGDMALSIIGGGMIPGGGHMIFGLFIVIMMGYCVIKIFFANLKRGGIL